MSASFEIEGVIAIVEVGEFGEEAEMVFGVKLRVYPRDECLLEVVRIV